MPTLSVVMIVKNEAQDLAACLECVHGWVDEIVILDSGSQDNTAEIAARFGAKFESRPDWQGFGVQRQRAQALATSDYVLWIDADERVSPELKTAILQAVEANEPNTLYAIGRLSRVFGREIRHSGWYPDFVTRLYPTALTRYNDALVHEKVDVPAGAQIKRLRGDLHHFTYKNLHHYLVKSAGYAEAWASQRAQQGKKGSLLDGFTHALGCFVKMYFLKAGFLDGKQGLLLAVLSAHSTFVKYADLWVRQVEDKTK